jgi:hypothetical protein
LSWTTGLKSPFDAVIINRSFLFPAGRTLLLSYNLELTFKANPKPKRREILISALFDLHINPTKLWLVTKSLYINNPLLPSPSL